MVNDFMAAALSQHAQWILWGQQIVDALGKGVPPKRRCGLQLRYIKPWAKNRAPGHLQNLPTSCSDETSIGMNQKS
jgi:hypothetical protein